MKRFYNNTLKRIASNRGMRLLALLFVLLGMSNVVYATSMNLYGDKSLGLKDNDATAMTASGDVYTYTFTATESGSKWVRIYAGDHNDANWFEHWSALVTRVRQFVVVSPFRSFS